MRMGGCGKQENLPGVDDQVAEVLHSRHNILRRGCEPAKRKQEHASEAAESPRVQVNCGIGCYGIRLEVRTRCQLSSRRRTWACGWES
jgi:hypothetical protein